MSLYTISSPLHYVVVYNIKSLTLCHCIQYQVPYTVSLYTVSSLLHYLHYVIVYRSNLLHYFIVYSTKSLTLCHCIQYQVPYTVSFVYSTESLTLCHCIQYQVSYTISLYTVPSPLHYVIVYNIKSFTLCQCIQYQVPYTMSLYTVPSPSHYVIVYSIKFLTLFHFIQYQVPYNVLLYTILSPLHCHCVQYQVPYTMTLHTFLHNVKPRTLKCALRMTQDFCSPHRNWLSWGLASTTSSLHWMSGAESTSSARASLAPWPSIPARPQSASTTAVWRSAPGNRSVRIPYPLHPNLSVVGDVVPMAQSAFLQLNTFVAGMI